MTGSDNGRDCTVTWWLSLTIMEVDVKGGSRLGEIPYPYTWNGLITYSINHKTLIT